MPKPKMSAEQKAAQRYRYANDTAYRERCKQSTKDSQHRRYYTDPVYREIVTLRNRIKKHRRKPPANPRVSMDVLLTRLEALKVIAKAQKAEMRFRPPRKGLSVVEFSEKKRKGMEILETNLQRQRDKKQAAQERKDLLAAWQKKWAHLRKKKSQSRKNIAEKRAILIKAADPKDHALRGQILQIHRGPCHCYWCAALMKNGGEVDHVVPLARGGTHSSGNICASCQSCNSAKNATTPTRFGEQPALL